MVKAWKWMLPGVAALGLLIVLGSVTKAEEKSDVATTASITGTVKDKDDAVVADAKVNLVKPRQPGAEGRPEPVATATTDKDGKFTLSLTKAVADGNYMLVCMVQGKGGARVPVVIKDGKPDPATADLKLAQMRRPGGGGEGGQGNREGGHR